MRTSVCVCVLELYVDQMCAPRFGHVYMVACALSLLLSPALGFALSLCSLGLAILDGLKIGDMTKPYNKSSNRDRCYSTLFIIGLCPHSYASLLSLPPSLPPSRPPSSGSVTSEQLIQLPTISFLNPVRSIPTMRIQNGVRVETDTRKSTSSNARMHV